jgi:hypothetical protein
MGVQFESITVAPGNSLTLIVDDVMRERRNTGVPAEPVDFEAWLNALQRQSGPLLQTSSARMKLEAWLEAVDSNAPEQAEAAE